MEFGALIIEGLSMPGPVSADNPNRLTSVVTSIAGGLLSNSFMPHYVNLLRLSDGFLGDSKAAAEDLRLCLKMKRVRTCVLREGISFTTLPLLLLH